MKKIQNQKNTKLKTFDQVYIKATKSRIFQKAYSEELMRLRLASEIKQYRTAKKLTQKAVAERAQMPQSVIARIESGNHSISLGTLGRVAQALGREVRLA